MVDPMPPLEQREHLVHHTPHGRIVAHRVRVAALLDVVPIEGRACAIIYARHRHASDALARVGKRGARRTVLVRSVLGSCVEPARTRARLACASAGRRRSAACEHRCAERTCGRLAVGRRGFGEAVVSHVRVAAALLRQVDFGEERQEERDIPARAAAWQQTHGRAAGAAEVRRRAGAGVVKRRRGRGRGAAGARRGRGCRVSTDPPDEKERYESCDAEETPSGLAPRSSLLHQVNAPAEGPYP